MKEIYNTVVLPPNLTYQEHKISESYLIISKNWDTSNTYCHCSKNETVRLVHAYGMANTVGSDQTAPVGVVLSWSTLFAHIFLFAVKCVSSVESWGMQS